MKKILLIGGTGTISTPVAHLLSENPDIELYILTRGKRSDALGSHVHRLIGDANDEEGLKKLLEGYSFDTVINFILFQKAQAEMMVRLFAGKVSQFIFISTNVALNHDTSVNVNESLPLGNEYSSYGAAKAECEAYFMQEYREHGFPVTIVRPTQTYSDHRLPLSVKPGGYWPVISRILRDKEVIVHGDGEGVWAGTHADDFARNFIGLVGNEKTVGEAYLIVNPEPYTWNNLYRALGEAMGKEVHIVHIPTQMLALSKKYRFDQSIRGDKYYSNIFDLSKLERVIGRAEFKISMKEGIRMYLAYMDEHPELKKEDPEFDAWCDHVIDTYRRCIEQFGNEDGI